MPGTKSDILHPGQIIGGCKVESFVARGAMGAVYRAHRPDLDKPVAVKVLQPALVENEGILHRFLREARVAAKLDHPNIVRVHDLGEQSGLYFIIMEFVDGRDLREWVQSEGRLSVNTALRIAKQVADALDYAHRCGVVHRDIKPANILLSQEGVAKVADLGLARPVTQDTQVTMTGEIIGTPVFMSPEQCRGDPMDGRTDLYSLGATLYMVLSGEPPFRGENTAVLLQKVLNDRPAPLPALVPGIPEGVTALVQRLMAKYPVARFQTGREVVEAITDLLVGRFHFAGETRSQMSEADPEPVSLLRWAGLCLLGVALGVVCYVLQPAEETQADTQPLPSTPVATWEPGPQSRIVPPPEPDSAQVPPTRALPQGLPLSDPGLQGRILELRNRLASGNIEECLECFHPDFRMDRKLRLSLGRFLQALEVQELVPGPQLAQQQGPDSATAILLFRHETKPVSLGLPVEWQRQGDGWYARPMNRTPALGR